MGQKELFCTPHQDITISAFHERSNTKVICNHGPMVLVQQPATNTTALRVKSFDKTTAVPPPPTQSTMFTLHCSIMPIDIKPEYYPQYCMDYALQNLTHALYRDNFRFENEKKKKKQ